MSAYPLQRGDRVLCYTDGVIEERDEEGEPFAGDEATVLAAMAELDRRWATSSTAPRRVPGEPGVTARLYADLRRHPPATSEPTL